MKSANRLSGRTLPKPRSSEQPGDQQERSVRPALRWAGGLRVRMTLSYIWVTVLVVAVLESCNAIFLTIIATTSSSKILRGLPTLPAVTSFQTSVPIGISGGSDTGLSTLMPPQMEPAIIYTWVGLAFMVGMVILAAPLLGGLFGSMTTRGLVRRLRVLTLAATDVATGDYTRRVQLSRRDELGDLEWQFNRMAAQIQESTLELQRLAEENARLAERKRISRDLHDAISQDLFSMHMLANGLHLALDGSELQPNLAPRAASLERTASNALKEMRALLLDMRPPSSLEQSDLQSALKELASSYEERLGIRVSADVNLDGVSLDPRIEYALLRVAQEAVSNAVRHAKANAITLSLAPVPPSLLATGTQVPSGVLSGAPPAESAAAVELIVTDDGRGLSSAGQSGTPGLGLRLMRERIEELGGEFSLQGNPGQGTTIRATVSTVLLAPGVPPIPVTPIMPAIQRSTEPPKGTPLTGATSEERDAK